MKSIALLVFILILTPVLKAQTGGLMIKSSNKGLYVEHKVAAKENFYSIGRSFNVHPKHLAGFNALDMSKGLSLGQTVKIPLNDSNFNQKTDKGVPVYYIAGNGETLYHVSINNRNVLMDKLRKWNHLSNDKPAAGTKLIVGYLNNEIPAMAVTNPQKTETVNKTLDNPVKDVAKNETVNKTERKKEETKQEAKKNNDSVSVKEAEKPQELGPGYFKLSFEQQIKQHPLSKEQTVTSGIFKTSSGWADAKYYLLMDGVEPGTIVRITNPNNNKMIYAKLLGEMSGLKQNEGLNIRISNAAADALEISEADKFVVKLDY